MSRMQSMDPHKPFGALDQNSSPEPATCYDRDLNNYHYYVFFGGVPNPHTQCIKAPLFSPLPGLLHHSRGPEVGHAHCGAWVLGVISRVLWSTSVLSLQSRAPICSKVRVFTESHASP